MATGLILTVSLLDMKIRSLFFFGIISVSVTLFNCQKVQDQRPSDSENLIAANNSSKQISSKSSINFTEYKIVIHKSLPEYYFTLYTHDDSLFTYYDSILVKDSNNKILQSINIYDNQVSSEIYSDQNLKSNLNFSDFNFDGIKDIVFERDRGATGNSWNNIYLYNNYGKFIYNYQLSELCLPSVDSLNRQIVSFHQAGGDNYFYYFYKWNKHKLILIREVQYWKNNSEPYQRRVELRRIDGKMKTVSSKIVSDNSDDP